MHPLYFVITIKILEDCNKLTKIYHNIFPRKNGCNIFIYQGAKLPLDDVERNFIVINLIQHHPTFLLLSGVNNNVKFVRLKPAKMLCTCINARAGNVHNFQTKFNFINLMVKRVQQVEFRENKGNHYPDGLKELRHGYCILKKLASFFKFVIRNPS